MRLPRSEPDWQCYKEGQLLFQFDVDLEGGKRSPSALVMNGSKAASFLTSPSEAARRDSDSLTSDEHSRPTSARERRPIHLRKRDHALEFKARELLRALGADELATKIRVEWNPRMRSAAGRADFPDKLISLNPLISDHDRVSVNGHSGPEIDRTLRHELAHLLAQWRVGRRRIAPHGPEWRRACRDLGIADEARCHDLPFASKTYPPRYVYRCPNCKEEFPRVRRIRRAIACLACCRRHNGGEFDPRFQLKRSNG
jgi:SprT protein